MPVGTWDIHSSATWETSLSAMEWRFLVEYRSRWPGTAYQLNQDPCSGHGHKAGVALFTLISNMGLVWRDSDCRDGSGPSRWLMPAEALVCQGFPVVPWLHAGERLCSFNENCDSSDHTRSARHVFQQVGNSMHVAVMAILQLHTLMHVPVSAPSILLQSLSVARAATRERNKRKLQMQMQDVKSCRIRCKSAVPTYAAVMGDGESLNYL